MKQIVRRFKLSAEDKAQLAAKVANIVAIEAPEDTGEVMGIVLILLFSYQARIKFGD